MRPLVIAAGIGIGVVAGVGVAYLSTKLWKYLSTKLWKSYPSQSKDTGKYKTEILQMQRLRDQLSNHGETTDRKLAQLKTQLEQGEGECFQNLKEFEISEDDVKTTTLLCARPDRLAADLSRWQPDGHALVTNIVTT
ncbi:hypothetical protein Fcan01_16853 [Folsomia candida]|uniref:Uncharacterized protein n=1 Tax=Folsomia candida TaxID=158441 RepID=A0A226DS65_FOLCA|nr:hypothetical protein Fcan01_16853 [Folsomia candida]